MKECGLLYHPGMTASAIEPAPGPIVWEKRLRAEPAEIVVLLRDHAICMVTVGQATWRPLVRIAERVMGERGIAI